MELLESERRILSPGCCTGEREKERERERGEGRGRELRTMHHAILLFYLKREWKIIRQDRDPRDSEYYTEIKHVTSRRIERQEDDETLQDRQEDELGGNREVRGEERWEREIPLRRAQTKDTDCGRHWKVTLEREVRRCSIFLLHLLTNNWTNSVGFAAVFILQCPSLICVSSVVDARCRRHLWRCVCSCKEGVFA